VANLSPNPGLQLGPHITRSVLRLDAVLVKIVNTSKPALTITAKSGAARITGYGWGDDMSDDDKVDDKITITWLKPDSEAEPVTGSITAVLTEYEKAMQARDNPPEATVEHQLQNLTEREKHIYGTRTGRVLRRYDTKSRGFRGW
jgi:hypothetical protein